MNVPFKVSDWKWDWTTWNDGWGPFKKPKGYWKRWLKKRWLRRSKKADWSVEPLRRILSG
jgi:hypothetical protein